MKTLHLINAWQATGGGGISTFYRSLMDHARSNGAEMVVVGPGATDDCTVDGSTKVYSVKSPVTYLNSSYRMVLPNRWPGVNRRVHEILCEEKPDLIDICDKYSLHYIAGLVRKGWLQGVRRPVLVGTSCERMDENMAYYLSTSDLARRFCRLYLKWNYFGFFDHHITVSHHTADELRQASRGHVTRRGVWVKPMGVSCDRFDPQLRTFEWRQASLCRIDANEGSVLLVYAGRLAPEKNLPLLFDVFETLLRRNAQDYRLVIAGDGMLRQSLEGMCRRRFTGGSVSFLGQVAPPDLAVLLANSDAFIHPNPAEPYGIAPLEAMASGLPLVACNKGGVLSYANPSNAWLSEASPLAMARSVDSVFEVDAVRKEKVQNALAVARSLDWPKVAADFRSLYASFVRGAALPAPAFESTSGNRLGIEGGLLARSATP